MSQQTSGQRLKAKDLAQPADGQDTSQWVGLPEPDLGPGEERFVERRVSSGQAFDGLLMKVYRDEVRAPDGVLSIREYTVHPGAALILPLFDDGRVLIERQFRYPTQQVFIEFPAGKLDPRESAFATAKRELLEETGYSAGRWDYVGCIHPVISYSTEKIDIFLARELTPGQGKLDAGEYLEVEAVHLHQLLEWVRDGLVTDAKTVAGTLWLDQIVRGVWLPTPIDVDF